MFQRNYVIYFGVGVRKNAVDKIAILINALNQLTFMGKRCHSYFLQTLALINYKLTAIVLTIVFTSRSFAFPILVPVLFSGFGIALAGFFWVTVAVSRSIARKISFLAA